MLDSNASVNFYMFFGGTNFGFTAGANNGGPGKFQADLTSYDYDAPIDEAGDPTPKYMQIRDAIKDYLPLPSTPVPRRAPKMKLPDVRLRSLTTLLSPIARREFGRTPIFSEKPLTFEAIDQFSGFLLYETKLPVMRIDPSVLTIPKLNDRAHVLIDDVLIGILSRESQANSIPISAGSGDVLQILVENQGRINYNIANDFKGIIGDVLLGGQPLVNWTITGFPFESSSQIDSLALQDIDTNRNELPKQNFNSSENLRSGPEIFVGTFNIDEEEIHDTYINPINWGKVKF